MSPARTVADQIAILRAELAKANRRSIEPAYDGPTPDEPQPDHLLDRHRADVDERYSDRAWGEVA